MRSKRKEVNKYSHKQYDDLKDGQIEVELRRNTGVKPFQLTKLRLTHRHVNESPLPSNELLHRRTGSNKFFGDFNQANLDLIIKQKLIIDAQFNQKLQSERKNLIYSDNAQDYYEKGLSANRQQEQQPFQYDRQGEENNIEEKMQQIHANTERRGQLMEYRPLLCALEQPQAEEQKQMPICEQACGDRDIQQIMKIEIKMLKQKTHPPFSFTSAKWRSKSENLQIDKWKQRYNKDGPVLLRQIQKQIMAERIRRSQKRNNRAIQQKNPIHSQEKQKVSLPTLQKIKQSEQVHSIVKLNTKKSYQKEAKSVFRIDTHPEIKTHRSLQLMTQKQPQPRGKRPQESLEEKVEIIIKKMYESQLEKYEQTAVSQADNMLNIEQQENQDFNEGKKKKKSKFPEIQITTFTSTKEVEQQKKKEKLEQVQKLAKQWRYVAPKKIYISKAMEEIPQRWQYGESRESRQEVDQYLQVKQQEKKEYEKVKSQQKEADLEDTKQKEHIFPEQKYSLTND